MPYLGRLIIFALGLNLAAGQASLPPQAVQSTGWNSSFQLSAEQLKLGNVTAEHGASINTMVNFDRSQLANGGAHEDSFYNVRTLPKSKWPRKPGQLIKLQEFTDPSHFSIPAQTAMSRIIYSTTNVNGTLVPASAYILWPYHPKNVNGPKNTSSSSAPVVLWTHGTSGFYANGAPSTHRGLFYENFVPFTLAEAGYAVVAPDYAGLGVSTSWDGTFIPHQYFASEASAGDALNALRAAQTAFPEKLSREFVVMGHSQGGSVAWRLSEILGRKNHKFDDVAKKHLGTIAAAPPTDLFGLSAGIGPFLSWIGKDLNQIYPHFNLSEWLTPLGVMRTELLNQLEGSQMVADFLLNSPGGIVQPDWKETAAVRSFGELANPGGKPIKGPLLILQGTADPVVSPNTTKSTVHKTCQRYPVDLELLTIQNGNHFATLNAARPTWLQWIEERFNHQPVVKAGCLQSELHSFLPQEHYQTTPNSFILWAGKSQWAYELPTAA